MDQIDVLPDDALLETFDFYVDTRPLAFHGSSSDERKPGIESWQVLVHVCRRWRSLVFASPRRLNLRLHYSSISKSRIKEQLGVWPAASLIVDSGGIFGLLSPRLNSANNTIAALGHSNRICEVFLYFSDWELGRVLAAMQVPFPELTDLRISSPVPEDAPTVPDSFLGGSAPCLKSFKLISIAFPGLPKLLLSATHLVELCLINIPHSGYVSPEAVLAIISVSSGLRIFSLLFKPHQSLPVSYSGNRPPIRSMLPALERFHFRGASKYLVDLVTGIDAPHLDEMHVAFCQANYDGSLLAQFIDRSPKLRICDEAQVQFKGRFASIALRAQHGTIKIEITRKEPDQQFSSVVQVCNSSMDPISTVENLYIVHQRQRLFDGVENALWLQFLLMFTAVKNLYLSKDIAPRIATALKELVGDRITEVLPNLQKIFVEGFMPCELFRETVRRFRRARRLSDHPITIYQWR